MTAPVRVVDHVPNRVGAGVVKVHGVHIVVSCLLVLLRIGLHGDARPHGQQLTLVAVLVVPATSHFLGG